MNKLNRYAMAMLPVAAWCFFAVAGTSPAKGSPAPAPWSTRSSTGTHTFAHSKIALDSVHLILWHVDSREDEGAPRGWGAIFSWSRYYNVMRHYR